MGATAVVVGLAVLITGWRTRSQTCIGGDEPDCFETGFAGWQAMMALVLVVGTVVLWLLGVLRPWLITVLATLLVSSAYATAQTLWWPIPSEADPSGRAGIPVVAAVVIGVVSGAVAAVAAVRPPSWHTQVPAIVAVVLLAGAIAGLPALDLG